MLSLKRIWLDRDPGVRKQWIELLESENLRPENDTTYAMGFFDDEQLVATGALAENILKYLIVSKDYQSENLMTQIIGALLEHLHEEEINHYFVYTKPNNETIFHSLGFKTILETKEILFLEQGKPNFEDYVTILKNNAHIGNNGGIVMNANPFTKGHYFLAQKASQVCDYVYVFVVSEEKSEFSSKERLLLVKRGLADLDNVIVLSAEEYMVSSLTFPSYFLKDKAELAVATVQARLDAELFKEKIAPIVHIQKRFVGEEPYSKVTAVYNDAMREIFQPELELIIVPRLTIDGEIVSATKVRTAIQAKDEAMLQLLLPETTLTYLKETNKI